MRRTRTAGGIAATVAILFALSQSAFAQSSVDYNRLEVGQTLPGGYVITQRYGPRGFLARRGNDLFYVHGSAVTLLNPRYAIGPQIENLDPRRRRFRDN